MLVLVLAHPYPDRSRANRQLLDAVRDIPGLDLRSLYDLYPNFDIDADAEQAALERASVVIWQCPMYWYSVPGLLKHWFDKVLVRGWAYGAQGTKLHGKRCLWVTTTGGDEAAFGEHGMHGHDFTAFEPAIKQTAVFCGMRWEPPFVVNAAHRAAPAQLASRATAYRARLEQLAAGT